MARLILLFLRRGSFVVGVTKENNVTRLFCSTTQRLGVYQSNGRVERRLRNDVEHWGPRVEN